MRRNERILAQPVLVFLFLLLNFSVVSAQTSKADTLSQHIKSLLPDTTSAIDYIKEELGTESDIDKIRVLQSYWLHYDYKSATDYFRRLQSTYPDSVQLLYLVGRQSIDPLESIQIGLECIRKAPEWPYGYRLVAITYERTLFKKEAHQQEISLLKEKLPRDTVIFTQWLQLEPGEQSAQSAYISLKKYRGDFRPQVRERYTTSDKLFRVIRGYFIVSVIVIALLLLYLLVTTFYKHPGLERFRGIASKTTMGIFLSFLPIFFAFLVHYYYLGKINFYNTNNLESITNVPEFIATDMINSFSMVGSDLYLFYLIPFAVFILLILFSRSLQSLVTITLFSILWFMLIGIGILVVEYTGLASQSSFVVSNVSLHNVIVHLSKPVHLLFSTLLIVAIFMIAGVIKGYKLYQDQIERMAEKHRNEAELTHKKKELERAKHIQHGLLPHSQLVTDHYLVSGCSRTAEEVGGDYYDYFALDDGKVLCVIGDVSGHGIASGLLMSMAKASLHSIAASMDDPADIVKTINRIVKLGGKEQRMFMTFCLVLLDPVKGLLSCSVNGHPFPLVRHPDGTVAEITNSAYPLGIRNEIKVKLVNHPIAAGDNLLLYTDGLPERLNPDDQPWSYEAVKDFYSRKGHKAGEHFLEELFSENDQFADGLLPDDDISAVLIEIRQGHANSCQIEEISTENAQRVSKIP